ncbi:MAG: hypothetical protein JWM30_1171 [Burkholderia sp.]|nr:hypothetical protein [Burkholderia sp.]
MEVRQLELETLSAAQPVKKFNPGQYNGYVNSTTYWACLYLPQESSVYHQISDFVRENQQVYPLELAAKLSVKRVREDSDQMEGLRRNVICNRSLSAIRINVWNGSSPGQAIPGEVRREDLQVLAHAASRSMRFAGTQPVR